MSWFQRNSLVISIIAAVILASLTPDWGANGGYLHSQILIKLGVIVIFLAQGFTLSTKALVQGIRHWPLHVFVQFWIFLGIPILSLTGILWFGHLLPAGLRLGLFFLSILPTTISSAIALVSHAEGNIAGAVFNTVLSNLSAVFLLPVWLLCYQSNSGTVEIEIWPVFLKLVQLLLLPFFVGHLSRFFLKRFELRIKKLTRPVNQSIIVFMVYAAFATSFRDKVWTELGPEVTLQAFLAAITLLIFSSLSVWISSRMFFQRAADRISAFFVGSQKSLAVGIPYSVAFFASLPIGSEASLKQSIIILPLLFYHPLQLLLASLMLRFKTRLFGET